MYCVKCGVELADSEKRCPLCKTVVYHPDIKQDEAKSLYPQYEYSNVKVNTKGVLLIVSILFGIIALLALVIDTKVTTELSWSGYAIGGLSLIYVVAILPTWFKLPNPVIFSSIDFIAGGAYLFYLNYMLDGNWFLTLALPLTACAAIITVTVITLLYYVRRGQLFIFGGAIIAIGAFAVAIEVLIHYTMGQDIVLEWSPYPLGACLLIGIAMIVIAICAPLREMLRKKFFI